MKQVDVLENNPPHMFIAPQMIYTEVNEHPVLSDPDLHTNVHGKVVAQN